MKLYTIGFTQKSAKEFFDLIKRNEIELLIDIRLNNVSQLAGFAKGKDLEYFLNEICNCKYVHDDLFAPTKELLDDYRAKKTSWDKYEEIFSNIINVRNLADRFKKLYTKSEKVCLLCTEPTAHQCHRRLVAEYLKDNMEGVEIIHI